jgi:hypothetical protein
VKATLKAVRSTGFARGSNRFVFSIFDTPTP